MKKELLEGDDFIGMFWIYRGMVCFLSDSKDVKKKSCWRDVLGML